MAKVVISNLAAKTRERAKKKSTAVAEKRIRDRSGQLVVMRTVDMSSPTLADDLTYVFKGNVAKARRENKRLVGAPDRVPAKS